MRRPKGRRGQTRCRDSRLVTPARRYDSDGDGSLQYNEFLRAFGLEISAQETGGIGVTLQSHGQLINDPHEAEGQAPAQGEAQPELSLDGSDRTASGAQAGGGELTTVVRELGALELSTASNVSSPSRLSTKCPPSRTTCPCFATVSGSHCQRQRWCRETSSRSPQGPPARLGHLLRAIVPARGLG